MAGSDDLYSNVQEKFKSCKLILNAELISKINAFKLGKLDELGFIQLMKSFKLPKEEIEKVSEMIKVWKANDQPVVTVEQWNNYFEIYFEELPKEKKYIKIKSYLNKRDNEKNEGLRAIDDFILSLNSENFAWIKRASKKILTYHPSSLRYFLRKNQNSEEQVKKFLDLFNKYLTQTADKFEDPLLKTMIHNHINAMFFLPFGMQFEMAQSLSLSDLRQNSASHIWGGAYFDFWFNNLLGRSSFEESQEILAKNLDQKNLNELHPWRLWVLLFHIKGDESWRKVMNVKLNELFKQKDSLSSEIFISLMRESAIKGEFSRINPDFSLPLFRLERQHYRECLKNRSLFNYCLIRLVELGDIDNTVLWYYVLNEVGVL